MTRIYRIEEFCGKFEIQARTEREEGGFWKKKKTIVVWKPVTTKGDPCGNLSGPPS